MPKPPAPPRPKPIRRAPAVPEVHAGEPLAEVERALSILQGLHPEAVRADRETQAALSAKRAQTEALAERAGRRERWTKLARVGVCVGVLVAVLGSGNYYRQRIAEGSAVQAALAPVAAPYLALGFAPVSSSRFARDHLEVVADKPGCAIALAGDREGLVVARASGALESEESIAWCSCGEGERVTVRLRAPRKGSGLLVLQRDARAVGGDYGLRFLVPQPRLLAPPDECSSESLDAWLTEGHAPVSAADEALGSDLRKRLARDGFRPVASASRALPFAAVAGESEACAVAVSTVVGDALSLRLPGGERSIASVKGAVGFCARLPTNLTVWRDGGGEVVVERMAAARIGGTHGLHEAAARLGLGPLETWVPPEDLAWDASSTLRASGVSPPEISASSDGRSVANAHLLALSIAGAMVRVEASSEDAYLCEPPLTVGSKDAVCVQGSALAWHAVGTVGRVGIAEAALPFWMQAFAGVRGASLFPVEETLLKIGRRLIAEGFEPTVLDGITELPDGALITGRAGDDAVVAVQLARQAPWAILCSNGGAGRTLDGEPDFVPLAPGAEVKLACGHRPGEATMPPGRRTVVFRHPTAK